MRMEAQSRDLNYFKLLLESETDESRRCVIFQQIQNTERFTAQIEREEGKQMKKDQRHLEIVLKKINGN